MKSFTIATILLLCCLLFAACTPSFQNPGDSLGGGGVGEVATEVDTSQQETAISDAVSEEVYDQLSANTGSGSATVVQSTDQVVEISESGEYYFSGNYSGGIYIAAKGLTLHFIFDGANISCANGVAINGTDNKNTQLTITIAEGTTNSVQNGGDDVNAIHIKGTLAINGGGTLNVTSGSKSGIKVSKQLTIVDSTVNVAAQNHGFTAMTIVAEKCTLNVTEAGKDGLNAECDDDVVEFTLESGYISLKQVNYTCNVSGDGIQADTFVYIDGGTYNITTNGVFVENTTANMQQYDLESDDFRYIKSGSSYQKVASDYISRGTMYALTQSCKGVKVGEIDYEDADGNEITVTEGDYSIVLQSGTFVVNSTDDSIHANSGDVFVRGGTYTLTTLDDALTADCNMIISGGDITVTSSFEGIEGANVEISGGNISVVSSDDGINAASDDTSIVEHIIISGGNIVVDASGDGLDSNGSILLSGGVVIVYGPTSGADGALDADRGIVVNGGTLFAASTLGMVETPSTNSQQFVVSYAQSTQIAAGTMFYVTDSDGNVLLEVEVQKSCQTIIFSVAQLQQGSSYTIYGGDTKLATFTVQSTITSVGSGAQSNNPGGRPGGGGGRPF